MRALADSRWRRIGYVANAYGEQDRTGPSTDPEALRPAPHRDDRPRGAKAAMDSGVATRPLTDLLAYRERLLQFVYTRLLMADLRRSQDPKRIVCQAKTAEVRGGRS